MLKFRAGTVDFTLPSSWDELTLGQFLALNAPDAPTSPVFIITTLSGLSESVLRPQSAPFDLTSVVVQHLDFLSDPPEAPDSMPKSLTIEGKTIRLPQDIGAEATLGQMWDVDLAIQSRQKDQLPIDPASMATLLLPVFLWPLLRDEPYTDHHQAAELWPLLSNLPCIEGLAVAGFFLRSTLQPSSSGKVSVSKHLPTRSSNWRQHLYRAWQRIKPTSLLSS